MHTNQEPNRRLGWAVDIDDMLCPTALRVIEEVFEIFPVENITPKELRDRYDQPGNVPAWQEEGPKKLMSELLNDRQFMAMLPVNPEALDVIQRIGDQGLIHAFITSRLHDLKAVTEEWLVKHDLPQARLITRHFGERNPNWKLRHFDTETDKVIGLLDNSPDAFLDTEKLDFKKIWLNETEWWAALSPPPEIIKCRTWGEVELVLLEIQMRLP